MEFFTLCKSTDDIVALAVIFPEFAKAFAALAQFSRVPFQHGTRDFGRVGRRADPGFHCIECFAALATRGR